VGWRTEQPHQNPELRTDAGVVSLPEILDMSHRILVMRGGRIVADIPRQDATEESIMAAATGQVLHSAPATG
jgi:ABC-type uncharacterized transport system ATPase subunit